MSNARFRIHVWLKVRRQRGKKPLLAKHRGWDANVSWIETHQTLIHHRKTNRAIALLKCNRYKFVGHMVALWLWALDQVPSGNFGDLLPAEIADAAGWDPAKGEVFVNALIAVGFIDEDGDDGLRLHNWGDYTGRLMAKREAGRKGGIASGEARRAKQNDDVLEANTNVASTPTSPHLTSPTVPNRTVPTSGSSTRDRLKAALGFTPEQWKELLANHPGVNVHARYWDWIDWIGESEEKRMPEKPFFAFDGFLGKKRDVTYSAGGGAGQVLREIQEPYGANVGPVSTAAAR